MTGRMPKISRRDARCTGLARALAVLVGIAILALGGGLPKGTASAQATLQADLVGFTEGTFPNLTVVLNLQDADGASVTGLGPADFSATIAGTPAPVKSASLASSQSIGQDVLLVIDTTGSMQGERLVQAKSAAKEFVAGLAPDDRVAVMRFANSVTVPVDFTSDHAAVDAAIDGLTAAGQTELYKATAAAAVKIGQSSSPRRAVVLLTDGANDAIVTDVNADQAVAAAAASGVPFFAIAQSEAAIDPAYLIRLASSTGGRYLEAPKPDDLHEVYASIGRLLRSQYVLTLDASAASGRGDVDVAVTVRAGGRTASASGVFHPSSVFAAPTVTVVGVTQGDELSEPRDITVSSGPGAPIERVTYFVDGAAVAEATTPPFTFRYDPAAYGEGSHTLRVEAAVGATTVASVPLSFLSRHTAPVEAPPPPEAGRGGGLPLLAIGGGIAGVMVLVLLFAAGVAVSRRLRTPVLAIAAPEQRVTPWAGKHRRLRAIDDEAGSADEGQAEPEDIGEPLGLLISRAGSDAGREYEVGGVPISIGSGRSCGVRIDDDSLATEEARIWVRNSHLMFHRLTRLTVIATDGISGGWQILEPGDTFDIGSHRFEFRLLPSERPAETTSAELVANVLRDAPAERSGPMPQPRPSLLELMPQDFAVDDEERAS